MKRRIIDILLVTIGSFIAAVGYNSLLVKNNIASGGVCLLYTSGCKSIDISSKLDKIQCHIPSLLILK